MLLIDDDAGNVERARAAGWCAIQYLEAADFKAALERLLSL